MNPEGYQWCSQGKRALLVLLGIAVTLAVVVPLGATDPGHYIGFGVGLAVLGPFLLWWAWQHRAGSPLVSVSEVGITPHEWSATPIPWSEVLHTRLDSYGIHTTLRIATTESDAVRRSLRPIVRCFVRGFGWWWVRRTGIAVTLSMMGADDRAHFLDVLDELGYGPVG